MKPWVHIGHMPLLVLLVIAAATCLVLIAELRSGIGSIVRAAPPGWRLIYGLGGLVLTLAALAIMILIAGFIGFGFGPFYLLASAAFVMFIAIPAFAIPPINRVVERLSSWQTILWASAIIVISLVLAFLYLVVAIMAGLPMQFGA